MEQHIAVLYSFVSWVGKYIYDHLYVARDHLVEQSTKLGVTLGKVE